VLEGGTYHFQLSDFNISAPPEYDINIVIDEDKLPRHGRLYIQTLFSNSSATYFGLEDISKLRYTNDDLENLMDSAEIKVEAEGEGLPGQRLPFILWIVIEQVNHFPPVISSPVENLTVVRGGTVLINEAIISAHDSDAGSDDEDLQWSADYTGSGYLFLVDDPATSVRRWTEGDMRNNRLYYQNSMEYGGQNQDFLSLHVSDGERGTLPFYLLVEIVSVVYNRHTAGDFHVMEGGSKRISFDNLRYYSINDKAIHDSDFLLTLERLPTSGMLTLDEKPLLSHDNFTQDKINTNLLEYSHNHMNTEMDNFRFTISVPSRPGSSKLETFNINIDPVDDDPPVADIPPRMFVEELQQVEIDNTTFRILDFDSHTKEARDKVVCRLVEPLMHGRLEKQRRGLHINHTDHFTKLDLEAGKVYYRHLGLPSQQPDRMVFTVTDSINPQPTIYSMTIIILPRIVSLTLNPLTVMENYITVITDEVSVNHPYLSRARGNFRVVEGSGPQHGRLVNTETGNEVHSFTTEDIANRTISYYHSGEEGLQDSFKFVYEALEPPGYDRTSRKETFHIDILPLNDEQPIIHGNTSLRLWATETVVVDERYFNITDYDTPPNQLVITLEIQTIHGHFAFAYNTDSIIREFTQAQVLAHVIRFVHIDGPSGRILYTVRDGPDDHSVSGVIPVYADTLVLECFHRWNNISVEFLGVVMVTSANLRCTTSDGVNDREIVYSIPNSRLGHFEVNSSVQTVFNSTELNAGLVMFVHTETGLWMETERLLVSVSSHPASPERGRPLFIEVRYPHPPLGSDLAVNTGINLTEGGIAIINESTLDARNLRYEAWTSLQSPAPPPDTPPEALEILFTMVQSPHHGKLTLNGDQIDSFMQQDLVSSHLLYTHDGSETLADSILLNVTVQHPEGVVISHHGLESVHIAVTPVNDEPPILQASSHQKSLVKNFVAVLSSLDIEVTDGDNTPAQLQLFLLSPPNNTQILLNGSVLTANSTITQQDINQQLVSLNPFAEGVSSFVFTFTDGSMSSEEPVEFALSVDDHYLELVHSQAIVSSQTAVSGTIISSDYLDTHTNGYRGQTVFTVTGVPCCGQVMLGGAEVQTFTQEDIDGSRVSYVPYSDTHGDTLPINISNNNLSISVNVSIHIIALGRVTHANATDALNFSLESGGLVQVLPTGVLVLEELKQRTGSIPVIELLQSPSYGHLEMRVPLPDVGIGKRSTDEIRQFRYDELRQGWIVYVWGPSQPLNNEVDDDGTVTDSFDVLVRAKDVLPGRATIAISLYPPSSTPLTSDPSMSTALPSNAMPTELSTSTSASSGSDGGFPVYTLIPIIGIILFLLLLIVVVVAFCLSQQKRIKKKWVPTLSLHHHQHHSSPWPASSPPIPTQVAHYDYDPSGMPIGESEHHASDTSSGFSEPDCSPRETPIQSLHPPHPLYSSPSYHPRSRMRSNVSITFSSRQSTVSEEMSVDEDAVLHSSLSQYPPQTSPSVTLPVRPASHTAFNRPVHNVDSGMVSHSSGTVLEESSPLPAPVEKNNSISRDDVDAFEWTEGKALPDFSDPNIQRLFHAHNPVLKKEEYWV
jgi:hypothetical protein